MDSSAVIDPKSEAAIFSRVVDRSLSAFNPQTASALLELGFSEEDHARVDELASRNQDGALSPVEKEELMNYVKIGNLLAILRAKARKSLKEHSPG